ncbi:MAG: PQQ-dependent sugar dehydrogenase [Rhodospirillales bacterium]|jgi:glucose/arabinose dehydrogenase|nr:PQQ-dependent sugar dehydrogenase [Rhodospirillales bacterium]MDP7097050.1 PQQ-dependent sugar dehydrogenase [Rhodospirillales bacterium]MDP7214489.1 PQQ-dependent sugar dehydrogenase [Rhodospirillales bacterium]HJP53098.1 PQQ-dependent sugar dehydrogenase [Rhodospirillales bacterium]
MTDANTAVAARLRQGISILLAVCLGLALPAAAAAPRLDGISLPPGFKISIYARVPGARSMAVAAELGVVFVGTRADSIYAVVDADGDRRADKVVKVKAGLHVPNGIAWRDGYLYVAEQHRVVRFPAADLRTLARAPPQVLFDGLPDSPWHGWRYAAFGADGKLYVAVGSPCNICEVSGLEGTIIRLDPAGGEMEVYAGGIRNSVGMDFHPATGELHFTDNGADNMGDDVPPDELNRAPGPGLDFGFPFYGGGDARTGAFKDRKPPPTTTMPEIRFAAHVAALGIHFYGGAMFPEAYRNDAFVAQHGSWNRTIPDGYRVVRVKFDRQGHALSHERFAEGWLVKGKAWGRPVDVKELADGSLLVSDDRLGAIYRITYRGR